MAVVCAALAAAAPAGAREAGPVHPRGERVPARRPDARDGEAGDLVGDGRLLDDRGERVPEVITDEANAKPDRVASAE